MQYVRFEQSYDDFHSRANNIYRIVLQTVWPDGSMYSDAANVAPLADVLRTEYPVRLLMISFAIGIPLANYVLGNGSILLPIRPISDGRFM